MLATVKGDVHDIGKNIVGVVLGCANYDIVDLGVMVPAQTIIDTARERGADIVGLSGLITPSLDEMVHVASEMERQGMAVPLLIGGATTSRIHTALRVDPAYSRNAVVHVADASRAAGVISKLLSDDGEQRDEFLSGLDAEYRRVIEAHERAEIERNRMTIERGARQRRGADVRHARPCSHPRSPACVTFDALDVGEIAPYIDWTPFFHVWGLRGRYPAILEDGVLGDAARPLFEDAQRMLDRIVAEQWFAPKAAVGFWPAHRDGDDIVLASDGGRVFDTRLHGLRQQLRRQGKPNLSISDFVAPATAGVRDHVGAFVVTAGPEEIAIAQRFEAANDDYSSIMVKALADRIAEALAELMHARVRRELWGYAPDESFTPQELIGEPYRGIRPAPGYPAQPDHSEKVTIFELLEAERRIGVSLTESYAMWPGSSVSGLYLAHPDAKYFAVGRVQPDQVEDYAARKGITVERAEQLLGQIARVSAGLSFVHQFVAMYCVSQNS